MSEKKIKCLTLYFEDGADPSKVDDLANKAQDVLDLWCSGGGFTPLDRDFNTFSEEQMTYSYREPQKRDIENASGN